MNIWLKWKYMHPSKVYYINFLFHSHTNIFHMFCTYMWYMQLCHLFNSELLLLNYTNFRIFLCMKWANIVSMFLLYLWQLSMLYSLLTTVFNIIHHLKLNACLMCTWIDKIPQKWSILLHFSGDVDSMAIYHTCTVDGDTCTSKPWTGLNSFNTVRKQEMLCLLRFNTWTTLIFKIYGHLWPWWPDNKNIDLSSAGLNAHLRCSECWIVGLYL